MLFPSLQGFWGFGRDSNSLFWGYFSLLFAPKQAKEGQGGKGFPYHRHIGSRVPNTPNLSKEVLKALGSLLDKNTGAR